LQEKTKILIFFLFILKVFLQKSGKIKNYFLNISNLKITNRTLEFYDLLIDIEVHDLRHLMEIIAALRATPAINMVERAHG